MRTLDVFQPFSHKPIFASVFVYFLWLSDSNTYIYNYITAMSTQNSLRPAWHKGAGGGSGRGFQPPPTASDRGDKARSSSWGSQGSRDGNKFSALLDDDDDVPPPGLGNGKSEEKPSGNSRSEAFRTSFGRGSSSGNKKPSGRSLADLAARVPDNASSGRRSNYEGRSSGTGRFSGLRSGEQAGSSGPSGSIDSYKPDPKVIRYTREKLLSMRPPSNQGPQTLPPNLTHLEGSTILSKTIQDPGKSNQRRVSLYIFFCSVVCKSSNT